MNVEMHPAGAREALLDEWLSHFPAVRGLNGIYRDEAIRTVRFKALERGAVAYTAGQRCESYLMCVRGRTRIFKVSDTGRTIMLYGVGPGETCVLTTSCLLARTPFPAESTAESETLVAALPADRFQMLVRESVAFREFVLADYAGALANLIALVDDVAFGQLDRRLARRLLASADPLGVVRTTHQQLALDLGSVREVVSRTLAEWERRGWIDAARGVIALRDRAALAAFGGAV